MASAERRPIHNDRFPRRHQHRRIYDQRWRRRRRPLRIGGCQPRFFCSALANSLPSITLVQLAAKSAPSTPEVTSWRLHVGRPASRIPVERGKFSTIDFPGATNTTPVAFNPQGDIVGGYNVNGIFHGFLLSDGDFTSIDFPNSTRTGANGINARGDIAGRYVADGVSHAFLLSGGLFSTIDYRAPPSPPPIR